MRTSLIHPTIVAAAVAMSLSSLAATALAQRGFLEGTPKPPVPIPQGPTPRTLDGKPNFSGVWNSPNFGNLGTLPWQAWAEKLADERRKAGEVDDPEGKCLPSGVPRISPYPMKIVQAPDRIVMLFEGHVHSWPDRDAQVDGLASRLGIAGPYCTNQFDFVMVQES